MHERVDIQLLCYIPRYLDTYLPVYSLRSTSWQSSSFGIRFPQMSSIPSLYYDLFSM